MILEKKRWKMSMWEEHQIADKIIQILDVESIPKKHHLGRPYMTPYQIAIAFKKRFPETFSCLGLPLGGKGIKSHTSLAQYIARELSRHIKDKSLDNLIEGGFLYNGFLPDLTFFDGKEKITSSAEQSYNISLFRRKD